MTSSPSLSESTGQAQLSVCPSGFLPELTIPTLGLGGQPRAPPPDSPAGPAPAQSASAVPPPSSERAGARVTSHWARLRTRGEHVSRLKLPRCGLQPLTGFRLGLATVPRRKRQGKRAEGRRRRCLGEREPSPGKTARFPHSPALKRKLTAPFPLKFKLAFSCIPF